MAASCLGLALLYSGAAAQEKGEVKLEPDARPAVTIRFIKPPKPAPPVPPPRKPVSWLPHIGMTAAPVSDASQQSVAPVGPVLLVSGRTEHAEAPAAGPQSTNPAVDMSSPIAAALQELGIRPAAAQQEPQPNGEGREEYRIQLDPPGPQRVFRLESEAALFERMRQERRNRTPPERIQFPEEPLLSTGTYQPRVFAPITRLVEPNYVCHGRLYFERLNAERYGWEIPILQPLVSTAAFYWDTVSLPYRWASEPLRGYDCSAGKCLPGDPVPLLLYPPHLNLKGAVVQAGVVIALVAIFP